VKVELFDDLSSNEAGKRVLRAATLAVGTELTDGQVVDRNSAWISHKVTELGLKVIEHRSVADDRTDITRALQELSTRVDYLFVTGGLGPTTDDFTRDLISEVYQRPLIFDEASWRHLNELLKSRGIEVREIQKQQCYIPRGAQVLTNPVGTANAFEILAAQTASSLRPVHLIAFPGPPLEIEAVWELNLQKRFAALVDVVDREELLILRCLGRGESQVAEIVEEVICGHALKVGYRAHMPYVEVKLWYERARAAALQVVIAELEARLAEWIVNRNDEDLVDSFLEKARKHKITVDDSATGGLFAERVVAKIASLKAQPSAFQLSLQTHLGSADKASSLCANGGVAIRLTMHEAENHWLLEFKNGAAEKTSLVETPPYHYKVNSDRGRKYIVEKTLQRFALFFDA